MDDRRPATTRSGRQRRRASYTSTADLMFDLALNEQQLATRHIGQQRTLAPHRSPST
jgi:hypothetical protein